MTGIMKKLLWIGLVASLGLINLARAESVESPLIGLQYQIDNEPGQRAVYDNLPEKFVNEGGFAVGDVSIPQPYLVSFIRQNELRMWWFERLLTNEQVRRPQGIANRQTRKILDVVESQKDVYALLGCQLNGKPDPEIFALAEYNEQEPIVEWISQFHQVLRANRQTQKLETVNPIGVRCYNPSWGI